MTMTLTKAQKWVAILGFAGTLLGTWVVVPYKVDVVEKGQVELVKKIDVIQERTIRNDERIKVIYEAIKLNILGGGSYSWTNGL
jgi:hypothetical protein